MICDTDDFYEPEAFEIAVNRIESSPDCDTIIFAIYRPDKEPVEDPASRVTFEKRTIDKCLLSGQTYEYTGRPGIGPCHKGSGEREPGLAQGAHQP